MKKKREPLDDLSEIRSMMEKSLKFLSLSGFSGVFAGIFAIGGVLAAYLYLGAGLAKFSDEVYEGWIGEGKGVFILLDAGFMLLASLLAGSLLSMRRAGKLGLPVWDAAARRMFLNLFIPLSAGGVFCLALIYHAAYGMVMPCSLIFYGLALFNAGKYTLGEIRKLGLIEMTLGLLAAFMPVYGAWIWTAGFGLMHIIYGLMMYNKYEK